MKKTIGEQVAQYMADHGLKAAAMAQRAGTSRQNIEGLVKRDRYPRDYIDRLAAAMGISIDDLHAGKYRGIEDQSSNKEIGAAGEMSKDIQGQDANGGARTDSDVNLSHTDGNLCQLIPTSMPYAPTHLKSAILLMGSLLGALDSRSKKLIGDMLKDLALSSDNKEEIEDIADKAASLARVQKPVTTNMELNRAIRGRGDAVETGPAPLERQK